MLGSEAIEKPLLASLLCLPNTFIKKKKKKIPEFVKSDFCALAYYIDQIIVLDFGFFIYFFDGSFKIWKVPVFSHILPNPELIMGMLRYGRNTRNYQHVTDMGWVMESV